MTQFPFSEIRSVWLDGELVPLERAAVHPLAHALHYGSAVFEGIRCYDTARGPELFRLREHLERLLDSAAVYRMELAWGVEELEAAILALLRANGFGACYVRPLVYRGFGSIRMDPRPCPVHVLLAAWPTRGRYFGGEEEAPGLEVCVSSWQRPSPNTLPVAVKGSGNYLSSQLITMEAHERGFDEGIALDARGFLSEGAAENLFLVSDGVLRTPPRCASILPGITRASVLRLATDLGIEIREEDLPRSALYRADELFLSGTSVEVTPITSVDGLKVGDGRPGPVTRRLYDAYFEIVRGEVEDRHGWLTPVPGTKR